MYQKHVQGENARHVFFIAVLRRLIPMLGGGHRAQQWWEMLVEAALRNMQQHTVLVTEATGFVFDVLCQNGDESSSWSPSNGWLSERFLSIWMTEFDKTQTELAGFGSSKEKKIRQTLIQFGKKKPRHFLHALNVFFVKADSRNRALTLLCDFVQNQPPHLHQVLHTPLFENLLRCLQQDTSTTVINMAMTALIMLLPNMPSSLVPHLPNLFNIYARLLFWEREIASMTDSAAKKSDGARVESSPSWDKCAFSSEQDDTKIPHLVNYFTILYGLYPINFMDYVRKPQRYLRHANVANAEEIEVQPSEIRQKSERFRQCHLLHPNLYSLTIDSEKTDFGRWIKSEPPEVLAGCMALCLPSETDRYHSFEGLPIGGSEISLAEIERDVNEGGLLTTSVLRDASPLDHNRGSCAYTNSSESPAGSRVRSALLRRSSQSSRPSNRDSLEVRVRDNGADSPTLPPHLVMTNSQPHVQEMIASNKVIRTGLHQSLANDSVQSLSLSHQEPMPDKAEAAACSSRAAVSNSPVVITDPSVKISQLYRQVLLLNNDLNFERYLKQQHMAHIGELRRRQLRELATEAETQNLINQNRLLKKGLDDAKKLEKRVKMDAERGRTLAKKWETDLTCRLKTLREEQKKWSAEMSDLRQELDTVKEERDGLRKLALHSELRDLNARQDMASIEMVTEEMERLKREIDRLNVLVRDHEAREAESKAALREAFAAEDKVEKFKMMLKSMETELEQTRTAYESRVIEVSTHLEEAQEKTRIRQSTRPNAITEDALAASRAKQVELQKQLEALAKRNSALQSKYLDLKSSISAGRVTGYGTDSDAETTGMMIAGAMAMAPAPRARIHRGFSDPESFEGVAYNVSPPLEALSPGPSQSLTPPGEGKMSPKDRYQGRGKIFVSFAISYPPWNYADMDVVFRRNSECSAQGTQG